MFIYTLSFVRVSVCEVNYLRENIYIFTHDDVSTTVAVANDANAVKRLVPKMRQVRDNSS